MFERVMWQNLSKKYGLLGFLIILLACIKYTYGLYSALDIALYDESIYLYQGVEFVDAGLPAPLYGIWYYILSMFANNNIDLYYLNYYVITILSTLLIYIFFWVHKVPISVALFISWIYLISSANGLLLPKVSHFSLLIILICLSIYNNQISYLTTTFSFTILALFLSYTRPEYFLTYILSSILLFFEFVRVYAKAKNRIAYFSILYLSISILLLLYWGIPVSNRSFGAFAQHFSLNWVEWEQSSLNPWTDFPEIIRQNFGSAETFLDAFVTAPHLIVKHVRYNFNNIVGQVSSMVKPVSSYQLSMILFLSLTFIIISLSQVRYMQQNLMNYKNLLPSLSLFCLPAAISVCLIYPRAHYLLLLFPIILFIILLLWHRDCVRPSIDMIFLCILSVVIIGLTPSLIDFIPDEQMNLHTIEFIQSLNLNDQVNILEAEGGYNIYIGEYAHRVAEYEKEAPFLEFLSSKKINLIVVSSRLLNDTRFREDLEWQNFMDRPESFDYKQLDIPHTNRKLLIYKGLLED